MRSAISCRWDQREEPVTTNMGWAERLARLGVGILILGLYGAIEGPWKYLALLGLIPLGTALTGYCPMYAVVRRNRSG